MNVPGCTSMYGYLCMYSRPHVYLHTYAESGEGRVIASGSLVSWFSTRKLIRFSFHLYGEENTSVTSKEILTKAVPHEKRE